MGMPISEFSLSTHRTALSLHSCINSTGSWDYLSQKNTETWLTLKGGNEEREMFKIFFFFGDCAHIPTI